MCVYNLLYFNFVFVQALPARSQTDRGLLPADTDGIRGQLEADDLERDYCRAQFGGCLRRDVARRGHVAGGRNPGNRRGFGPIPNLRTVGVSAAVR